MSGHLLTRIDKKKFSKNFPNLVKYEDLENNKKPLKFYVEELKEETLAWEKGEKLAKRLGIPLNKKQYYIYASRFLLRYMALATVDRHWLLR